MNNQIKFLKATRIMNKIGPNFIPSLQQSVEIIYFHLRWEAASMYFHGCSPVHIYLMVANFHIPTFLCSQLNALTPTLQTSPTPWDAILVLNASHVPPIYIHPLPNTLFKPHPISWPPPCGMFSESTHN